MLHLTDAALETVRGLRDAEDDADGLALRVEVTGARGTDFTYDLGFDPVADAPADDIVTVQEGLTVWIPAGSVANLTGATLDVPSREGQGGLVLRNPNRPDPLGMDEVHRAHRHRRGEGRPSCSTSTSTPPSPPTAASPAW